MWGHGSHLTVHWDCNIKVDYVENYGHEGGQARKRVYLQQEGSTFNPQLYSGR